MTTSIITSPTGLTLSCRTCKLPSKCCACLPRPTTPVHKKRYRESCAMEDSHKKTRVLVERAQFPPMPPPDAQQSPIDRYMTAHPRRQLLMTLYRSKLPFVPIFWLRDEHFTILRGRDDCLREVLPWDDMRTEVVEAAAVAAPGYLLCLLDDRVFSDEIGLWYFHAPVDSIPPKMKSDYAKRTGEYAREVKNGILMNKK